MSGAPTRPVLRWHGGKWMLAPWIIAQFPDHRTYCEPYGGAGSVLIRKPRAYAEVYNDLDRDVVALFSILRDSDQAEKLLVLLKLTPFARDEFNLSYQRSDDPIEQARRLVVRSFMGFGSDGHNAAVKTGFRADSNKSGTTPAHDWAAYPDALPSLIERLAGVVIEHRPALQVMARHDGPETLTYLDPPYMPDTRSKKSRRGKIKYHAYAHEMTERDHRKMLTAAKRLKGMVIISGYPHPMYDQALKGWSRIERDANADGARKRVEVLWMNRACMRARARQADAAYAAEIERTRQLSLFAPQRKKAA